MDHQKIDCIYGVSDAYTSIQRTNGYKEGLLANKIKVDETIIRCGQSTLEGGYRETNWLLENAELDAIFVENNLMTLGVIKHYLSVELKFPIKSPFLGMMMMTGEIRLLYRSVPYSLHDMKWEKRPPNFCCRK